jgi:alpha-aminoadipic semialdehyde synthase
VTAVDASTHFSACILPYVERLVSKTQINDEISETLERAKIVKDGTITSEHSWLAPRVKGWRNTQASSSAAPAPSSSSTYLPERKKKVLLLGSGLVAGPAVDVFVARGDVELVIGTSRSTGFESSV